MVRGHMKAIDPIEGVLIAWGARVRGEDSPEKVLRLGYGEGPIARMYACGTVKIPADPCLQEDVERVCVAVSRLQKDDLDAVKALKARYVLYGVSERRIAKKLECTRHYFRGKLKKGREYVRGYL